VKYAEGEDEGNGDGSVHESLGESRKMEDLQRKSRVTGMEGENRERSVPKM
jgi:hypothetical protein